MSKSYYNDIEPFCCEWIGRRIASGDISRGVTDGRSIKDVRADELAEFTQCHFFAGIGGWSLALRLAGWPDSLPVWSGSCPCQPFSVAGKGARFDDERHLWPVFRDLIAQRRPGVVFGEQVGGKAGLDWFNHVQFDMEAAGYACWAVEFPACSVGAPHKRNRLYWTAWRIDGIESVMADLSGAGRIARRPTSETSPGPETIERPRRLCSVGQLADGGGRSSGLADTPGSQRPRWESNGQSVGDGAQAEWDKDLRDIARSGKIHRYGRPGPVNSFWRDADWLRCRDGKWRPVEPGTFPLAHGIPQRVGRLKGYGNSIVPQQAAVFIVSAVETVAEAVGFRVEAEDKKP